MGKYALTVQMVYGASNLHNPLLCPHSTPTIGTTRGDHLNHGVGKTDLCDL